MPHGSSLSLNVLRPGESGEGQSAADGKAAVLPALPEDRVSANRRELERDLREAFGVAGNQHQSRFFQAGHLAQAL